VVNASGLRRSTRFVVRVIKDGEALARQTGLIDSYRQALRFLHKVSEPARAEHAAR
jgi:hypothetical protein